MSTVGVVKQQMDDALDAVRREFSSVRTGKATPTILDTVRVEAYGALLPLNQVATVSVPEGSLLVVQPFDRSLIGDIERGIQQADLGLNPANDGQVVRIPIPPLNEERRKEYVRLLGKMAEEGRISIRHARREGNESVKSLTKEGELSDDEGRRTSDEIQKLTDEYIGKIDELLAAKEREIMTV
ncbi:MAG: ribosome recycling factor [Gemmatimonadota bacterium]